MAYSDQAGQILYQGHLNREQMRQQAEIAQMRWGGLGGGSGNSGGGDSDDSLKWLEAGRKQAESEAKMTAMGEEIAEARRQRFTRFFSEYTAAKDKAKKANIPFDSMAFANMMGFSREELESGSGMTFNDALEQGSEGLIKNGKGVKFRFGGEFDDLTMDNLAAYLDNKGYKIDYGAEETTMNLGTDDNLSTKEKFQKFGESVKQAFTPEAKTNKPLGKSFGVSDGQDETGDNKATAPNPNKQTTFEEGEQSSATVAQQSFTIDQLADAFNRQDFSSFSPEMQGVIRDYLNNTYVGYDKQGNPAIFNISEPFEYLTASQAEELKRQEANNARLNKSFPGLSEQLDMFPGDANRINQEQQQQMQQMQAEREKIQSDAESTLRLTPGAEIARNFSQARQNTSKVLDKNSGYIDKSNSPLSTLQANAAAPKLDDNGLAEPGAYPQDQLAIARYGANANKPEQPLTPMEKLGYALKNHAISNKYGGGTTNTVELVSNVMNAASIKEQEHYVKDMKSAVYQGRNILNSTTNTLSTDERKTVAAAMNMETMLSDMNTTQEKTHFLRNLFEGGKQYLPDYIADALWSNDETRQIQAIQKLVPLFSAGVGKQGASAAYLPTATIKEFKASGKNTKSIIALLDYVAGISINNLSTISDSNNNTIYPLVTKAEIQLSRNKTAKKIEFTEKLLNSLGNNKIVNTGKVDLNDDGDPILYSKDGAKYMFNEDSFKLEKIGAVVTWNGGKK